MADKVKNTEDTQAAVSGRKLAVLFPGIGYHCDKPLLYYAGKLAAAHGYEIIRISYHDLPGRIMGNDEKKRAAALLALEQAREQLADVDWQAYEDIVFINGPAAGADFLQNDMLYAFEGDFSVRGGRGHCIPRDRGSLGTGR